MPAAVYNLYIEQGATFQKTLTWKDSSGSAIDLTGYTARMQFRRSAASSEVLYSATTENGAITLGGAAGTIAIVISATATAAFTFGCAVYDLEVISSGGVVYRLLEGGVEVSLEVTRGA